MSKKKNALLPVQQTKTKNQFRVIVNSPSFSCDAIRPKRGLITFLKSVRKNFERERRNSGVFFGPANVRGYRMQYLDREIRKKWLEENKLSVQITRLDA